MSRVLRGVTASAVVCGLAATAAAVNINLSGGLGNGNWHTPSVPLGLGGSLAPIAVIQSVPGVGDFSCDVYADNSGTSTLGNSVFSLKVTNLVFQAYGPLPSTQTSVKLKVEENFIVPSALSTQAAALAMDGVMSSTGGCTVIGNAQFRSPIGSSGGTSLPSLSYIGGSPGPDFFNVAPSFATVSPPFAGIGLNVLFLQIQLEIFINGSGFVNMPSSFTASSESVPSPSPLALAALAAAAASRRRR
ncbi:MAG TPA: hypothetical protein VF777_10360 [Phycisphaerales bacterium]